jgi:AcrR family transcriptional regulator
MLDAALELFGTTGYASTSIDMICARSSVTSRYLYQEFGSKEGLVVALYDTIVGDVAAAVAAAEPGGEERDARAAIRCQLSAFVHAMVDDERKSRIALLDVGAATSALELRRREADRAAAATIGERIAGVGAGPRIAPEDLELAGLAVVGAVKEVLVDWLVEPRPEGVTVEVLIDDLLYAVMALRDGVLELGAAAGPGPPP